MARYFLTQDLDLYFILESDQKKMRQLWKLDLSKPKGFIDYIDQTFEMEKCFQYKFNDVKSKPLLDIMIRSESNPDNQNEKNLKLMAFFLHEGALFVWIQGEDKL